jgi:hypothetical protein
MTVAIVRTLCGCLLPTDLRKPDGYPAITTDASKTHQQTAKKENKNPDPKPLDLKQKV